jgi:F0F1-type ATP synthase membrane subunit b/b'
MIDVNASFLFQLGLFWLVIIILNNMFFKPMLKYLDYRKSLIEGRKAESEKLLEDIEDREKYYNSRIREAKERGMDHKKSIREEILKAQKEVTDTEQRKMEDDFSKSRNVLMGESEEVKKDISKLAGGLGRIMAEKILGREVQ